MRRSLPSFFPRPHRISLLPSPRPPLPLVLHLCQHLAGRGERPHSRLLTLSDGSTGPAIRFSGEERKVPFAVGPMFGPGCMSGELAHGGWKRGIRQTLPPHEQPGPERPSVRPLLQCACRPQRKPRKGGGERGTAVAAGLPAFPAFLCPSGHRAKSHCKTSAASQLQERAER